MTVVEGLSGGRVAVVNKLPHAMVDGISTVDLATLLLAPEPTPTRYGRPKRWRPRPAPSVAEVIRHSAASVSPAFALQQLASLRPQEVLEAITHSPCSGGLQLALASLRPGTPLFFNPPLGPHRPLQPLQAPLQHLQDRKTPSEG